MSYKKRIISPTNLYHIVSRGTGFHNIFEDDDDHRFLLELMGKHLKRPDSTLSAWCHMSDHFHLIAGMEMEDLSCSMRKILSSYAKRFNERHGRCGHLFQSRFYSEPITSEAHLLSAIRYVHQNPERAGMCRTSEYPWSSYREYVEKPTLTDTSTGLYLLNGVDGFRKFHEEFADDEHWLDYRSKSRMSDRAAAAILRSKLGDDALTKVSLMSNDNRDMMLRIMHSYVGNIRQLQRLTGIGRKIITRAVMN